MLKNFLFAISVAAGASLLTGGLLAPTPAYAQKSEISKKVGDPLNAGLEAAKKGRVTEALEKLKTADSASGKTAYEQYLINEAYGFVYLKQRNYDAAAAAYEKSLNSSAMPAGKVNDRVKTLAQLYFQAPRNLNKVIEYGNRYLKAIGGRDAAMQAMVGQAYQMSGNDKAAVAAVNNAIKIAGQPAENWLRILLKSYNNLDDSKGANQVTQLLVKLYPSQDNWRLLSSELRRKAQGDDRTALNVYRLMSELDILDNGKDCSEAAIVAMQSGLPAEAVSFMEGCIKKKAFGPDEESRSQRILADAMKRAAAQEPTLAQLQSAADRSPSGQAQIILGEVLLSYGQAEKALAAAKRGLAKPGANADDAWMLIGRADVQLKNSAEARKAFRQVKDTRAASIAELWGVHAAKI
ncbi:MAG: hypothetical protein R3F24_04475 [Gammaproteobacteria bacterium]